MTTQLTKQQLIKLEGQLDDLEESLILAESDGDEEQIAIIKEEMEHIKFKINTIGE